MRDDFQSGKTTNAFSAHASSQSWTLEQKVQLEYHSWFSSSFFQLLDTHCSTSVLSHRHEYCIRDTWPCTWVLTLPNLGIAYTIPVHTRTQSTEYITQVQCKWHSTFHLSVNLIITHTLLKSPRRLTYCTTYSRTMRTGSNTVLMTGVCGKRPETLHVSTVQVTLSVAYTTQVYIRTQALNTSLECSASDTKPSTWSSTCYMLTVVMLHHSSKVLESRVHIPSFWRMQFTMLECNAVVTWVLKGWLLRWMFCDTWETMD